MTNAEYQAERAAAIPDCLLGKLQAVAVAYTEEVDGCGGVADSAIRDILTDLRHLCDIHSLDFGQLDAGAYDGYLEECDPAWRNEEPV